MASKQYGGTRNITPKTKAMGVSREAFSKELLKGNVVPKYSYFSDKSGCSVIYQKGHNYHIEEIEAAKALADYGIDVVMQPESFKEGGVSLKRNWKTGALTFPEGTLNASIYYEQSTAGKEAKSLSNSVYNGLEHAREKNVPVAVIYDKFAKGHRADIDDGIKRHAEQYARRGTSVKTVLTIDKDKNVHVWSVDM